MATTKPLTFGSLFAGIGGFDLGFERAGMVCSWQVEIDDYARRVLTKHWPNVPKWDDVKTFPPAEGDWSVDVICGGFPCQDISNLNAKAAGIDGARSGLWSEYARIIRVLQPRFVAIENVKELTFRGLRRVLWELATLGFDAEWQTISGWAFGSHHKRKRLFVVAYRPDSDCYRWEGGPLPIARPWNNVEFTRLVRGVLRSSVSSGRHGRISDGVSCRVHRLRGLGNAVIPQIAEWIGRGIIEASET